MKILQRLLALSITTLLFSNLRKVAAEEYDENDLLELMPPGNHLRTETKAGTTAEMSGDGDSVTVPTNPVGMVVMMSNPNYQGKGAVGILSTNCKNIGRKTRRIIRSIDTRGHCVVLYTTGNCQGEGTMVYRHSQEAKDILTHIGTPHSLRLCSASDAQLVVFTPPDNNPNNVQWDFVTYAFPLDGSCVNVDNYVATEAGFLIFVPPLLGCIMAYPKKDCVGTPTRVTGLGPPIRNADGDLTIKVRSGKDCNAVDLFNTMYMSTLPAMSGNADTGTGDAKEAWPEIDFETGLPPGQAPDNTAEEDPSPSTATLSIQAKVRAQAKNMRNIRSAKIGRAGEF